MIAQHVHANTSRPRDTSPPGGTHPSRARRVGRLTAAVPAVTVGYLGRGEPVRRYQLAAAELGCGLVVVDPTPCTAADPARHAHRTVVELLDHLVSRCDVVTVGECDERTYTALVRIAGDKVRPNPPTIRAANEPLAARYLFEQCRYDVTPFEEVDAGDAVTVHRFAREHGWPVRLRRARWGAPLPDSHLVRPYSFLDDVWVDGSQVWLLEACEPHAPQIVVSVARRPSGDHVSWSHVTVPEYRFARVDPGLLERAVAMAVSIADGLDAVGLVHVTFLALQDGRLVVDDLRHGPEAVDPSDLAAYRAHLRGILDRPLDVAAAPSSRAV